MDTSNPLPVNHHADHPGFSGLKGTIFGLFFLLIGRPNARLAAESVNVTRDDRVVDIGCGPGGAVREAARRGARATGVDPSAAMLRVARVVTRAAPNVQWIQGTAENVPAADGSATVVWSLATVHHWKDVGAGLREAHRVLAPGGRLLAVERQASPGATGFASHGWTRDQAQAFAVHCRTAGFERLDIAEHDTRRGPVWLVSAVRT
jgi:ubiquinone/menaquinone biosynthesis C-methylase UbiE